MTAVIHMIPEKTVHQRIRLVVAPAAQSSTIAGDSSVPQPTTAAPSIDDHVSSAQTLSANARVQLGGATAEVSTACVHSDSCTCLAKARSNNTGVLTRVPGMQASVASATVMHLQGKDSFQAQLESTLHQQQVRGSTFLRT